MLTLKSVFLSLLVLSLLGLVWVATGHTIQHGYASCAGGGFIPQGSVVPDNPGGLCVGAPKTELVNGRYAAAPTYELLLGLVGGLCLIGCFLTLTKPRPSWPQNPYVRFLVLALLFLVLGIVAIGVTSAITTNYLQNPSAFVIFLYYLWLLILAMATIMPALMMLTIGLLRGLRRKQPLLIASTALFLVIVALSALIAFELMLSFLLTMY